MLKLVILTAGLLALGVGKVPEAESKYWTITGLFQMGGMVSGCSQEAFITHPVLTEDTDFPVIVFAHGMTVGGWKL